MKLYAVLALLPLSVAFAPFFAARPSVRRSAAAEPLAMSAGRKVNIGLVGGGVVGGGIVEILSSRPEFFAGVTGAELNIARIVVGNPSKTRDYTVPDGTVVSGDWRDVVNDPSIDMVVEVMGGTTDAKEVIFGALAAGKDVVTANKALIAADLPAIEALVSEKAAAGDRGPRFGYEAAVCGGIPIIRCLQSDLLGDQVTQVSGIMNGCTNFMLTAMEGGGSYDEALAEAGVLGYAEADPTLDVGGFDARSKLRILIKLAFGADVVESEIPVKGIQLLTTTDFDYCKMEGGTVKLLGIAQLAPDGELDAYVSPCYVPASNQLAGISGATNAIQVLSKSLQSTTLVGQGAGRYPTANACVADILALASGGGSPLPFPKDCPSGANFASDFTARFYIRLAYEDQTGIIADVGAVCAKHSISIFSCLQSAGVESFVVITDEVRASAVAAAVDEMKGLSWCKGDAFTMPVLD